MMYVAPVFFKGANIPCLLVCVCGELKSEQICEWIAGMRFGNQEEGSGASFGERWYGVDVWAKNGRQTQRNFGKCYLLDPAQCDFTLQGNSKRCITLKTKSRQSPNYLRGEWRSAKSDPVVWWDHGCVFLIAYGTFRYKRMTSIIYLFLSSSKHFKILFVKSKSSHPGVLDCFSRFWVGPQAILYREE